MQGGYGTQGSTSGWDAGRSGQQGRSQRRGPKGYQRSDQRIKEDICEHLMESAHIDSSEITIEVTEGMVIIEGTVPDRRMKHAIEDIAEAASGVNDVDNRVRVGSPEGQGRSQSGSSGSSSDSGSGSGGGSATERSGTGTTSSHTGGGTQSAGTATGASSGSSYGGATTGTSGGSGTTSTSAGESGSTPSRGSGSSSGLAGQSTSSSSTTKAKND
jgi:hypothetical protein